jgi:hypothetical protein
MRKQKIQRPNGFVLYEGPSAIDGSPIVVILVGLESKSANAKTGAMVQSYILRADVDPIEAKRAGTDGAICGTCPHRSRAGGGSGACYVNVGQGPRAVWYAWRAGKYPRASVGEALHMLRGRAVRIGSYGDPAAVPDSGGFWARLTWLANTRTGYTHRWRDIGAELRGVTMASVDSAEEAREARAMGWATFRVAAIGDSARDIGEARCPASAEAGKRVVCAKCPLACDGTRDRVVGRVIVAHGATRKRFAAA